MIPPPTTTTRARSGRARLSTASVMHRTIPTPAPAPRSEILFCCYRHGGRRSTRSLVPGVVVDLEGFLGRAFRLGDVLEVQPDPPPHAAAPAHPVDEDVGWLQQRPHRRVPGLPPLQAVQRLLFRPRPGDLDERRGGAPPPGRAA